MLPNDLRGWYRTPGVSNNIPASNAGLASSLDRRQGDPRQMAENYVQIYNYLNENNV